MVEIQSITRAIVLIDQWTKYAHDLERELDRVRRKYQAAHERCEQLREIVAQDYPHWPF